ncbi:MAG: cytochrome b/b6 domain-containing protein [Hyphomicrobiaceae bacterium]|nr:cytochrome b/b6 domain-containing protein [Hyphomicrobiaceae bacterium]
MSDRGDTRYCGKRRETVRAWDLPTRLFHWTLLTLVVSAYISFRYAEAIGDYQLKWHRANGIAVITLLTWRIFWAIVGSSTSRITTFAYTPIAAARYGFDLVAGRPRRYLGHNPLGAYVVIVLVALALTQASLGLVTVEHNDITAGPLYRLVSEETTKVASRWHRVLFYYVLLPAIALHITANLFYTLVKREALIQAMVTGRKPAAAPQECFEDQPAAVIIDSPMVRAAVFLALSAAVVIGPVYLASGRIY